MPIEIKELHIRISVSEEAQRSTANAAPADEKEKLIAACVEQVMELLAKKEER
jgi:hypothetical protein